MYGGDILLSSITGNGVTGAEEPATYAPSADFLLPSGVCRDRDVDCLRCRCGAHEVICISCVCRRDDRLFYPMEGSWTWGGKPVFGRYTLGDLGFLDFAGSGIVHMAGAAAALAGVVLVGARKGKYGPNGEVNAFPGANLPLATLGTFILWLGWFGFNGGSVLATASVECCKRGSDGVYEHQCRSSGWVSRGTGHSQADVR